jgi:hypothetical protein
MRAWNDIDDLSAGLPAFIFDKDKKHDEILVKEGGRVAEKTDGEDYQTVLLRPAIPRHGRYAAPIRTEKKKNAPAMM